MSTLPRTLTAHLDELELRDFLTQNPLPWLSYDEQKQKFVMVVDNHLLSTYRACPQHFVYAHIRGIRRKAEAVAGEQRNWFLDFGILLHKMLELYYQTFQHSDFDLQAWAIGRATAEWAEAKMNAHCEHKEYKLIGGLPGFVALLMQYAHFMSPQNDRIRVLGTEVSFGRNLEVPLMISETLEVYLAGRMDLIIDDGYFICPRDHKTMGTFRGDPGLRFETDEGPTGYIYALSTVLPQMLPPEEILKRDCTKIQMNLISKTPTANPQDRFKLYPIRKTQYQLAEYQQRMISTAEALLEDVKRVALDNRVFKNTQVCQNWMHLTCPYFDVCRQQSCDSEQATIKNGFVQVKLWNTEEVSSAS